MPSEEDKPRYRKSGRNSQIAWKQATEFSEKTTIEGDIEVTRHKVLDPAIAAAADPAKDREFAFQNELQNEGIYHVRLFEKYMRSYTIRLLVLNFCTHVSIMSLPDSNSILTQVMS